MSDKGDFSESQYILKFGCHIDHNSDAGRNFRLRQSTLFVYGCTTVKGRINRTAEFQVKLTDGNAINVNWDWIGDFGQGKSNTKR